MSDKILGNLSDLCLKHLCSLHSTLPTSAHQCFGTSAPADLFFAFPPNHSRAFGSDLVLAEPDIAEHALQKVWRSSVLNRKISSRRFF
jgi:hypothetical protein